MHEPTDTGVTQTITVGDGSGRPGNCLQAAVASLLGLQLEEVPHFLETDDWSRSLTDFARARGWRIRYDDQSPTFGLVFGRSPRDEMHAVVYRDHHMAWDPHPDRTGLATRLVNVHFDHGGPR